MLLAIREKARGWIAWVVIILIAAAFALFGLSSYFGPGGQGQVAVTVNGVDISRQQVDREFSNARLELERLRGQALSELEERVLRQQTLDSLISQQVVLQFVEQQGMQAGDEALATLIRQVEEFQTNGRFDRQRYEAFAARQGTSTAGLEAQLRQDMVLQVLVDGVGQTTLVTDFELDRIIALDQQTRTLAFLRVDVEAIAAGIDPGADAVEAYYQDNSQDFRSPDRVRLDYVYLDRSLVAERIEPGESDLRDRYQQVLGRYSDEETREASHILVQLRGDADEAARAAADSRVAEIEALLSAEDADFAAIARQYSQDRLSAGQGGRLGAVTRGVYGQEFDQALFAMTEPGTVTGPVRGEFGFHFIRLDSILEQQPPGFEELREEIRADWIAERSGELLFEEQRRLDELAYDRPDSLEPAAEALGLSVSTSDWIRRGQRVETLEPQLAHPDVLAAAFSAAVLERRENSAVINLGDDRYLALRVAEYEDARPLELAEVEETIRGRLRREQARTEAEARAEALLAELEAGVDLRSLADPDAGVTAETPGTVSRGQPEWPPALIQAAFALPRPGLEPSRSRVALADGSQAVLEVSDVVDGDLEAVSEQERNLLRRELARQSAQQQVAIFIRALRAEAEIQFPGQSD